MHILRLQPWLFGLFLCLHTTLLAQNKGVDSPITVGIEFSTALHVQLNQRTHVNQRVQESSYTNQIIGLKVGYRLLRWLEVWGRFQQGAVAAQLPITGVPDDDILTGGFAKSYQDTDMSAVFIGLKLLMRVGQGDLGLALGQGRSISTTRVKSVGNDGSVALFEFNPLSEWRAMIQFDYTYWPTKRFGIRAGINYSSTPSDTRSTFFMNDSSLNQLTIDSQSGVFYNSKLQNAILSRMDDHSDTVQFSLGFDYRF